MDFDSIYNNLFPAEQGSATATKEAAATQQNDDPPADNKAGMSKLAEDAETLFAAGQIFGMGYIQGAVKEAGDIAGSVDDKAPSGQEAKAPQTGGAGSATMAQDIPGDKASGPKPSEESSVKPITKANASTSGTPPDDVGDGEATEGGANGQPHPGIANSLKSMKDSFGKEIT